MAEQQQNPFELEQPKVPQPGMTQLVPQGGPQEQGGSYFSLSPEAMQMMWAPQLQQQIQAPPLPPPVV